ncbi:MAG: glycosyl hydrolase [Gemmatimonadaceae bacterium]
MPRLPRFLAAALIPGALVLSASGLTPRAVGAQMASPLPSPVDSSLLHSFKWRNLGPPRGGRSIAVSGVKGQPKVAYFGATGGGLWKTTNGGDEWAPVTDGQINTASIGAVGVSDTDPNEVLIGTGECEIRGDVMAGNGMYRSTDAGKTWNHVGFDNTDAICKVRVDPTNASVVFAAVFGKYAVPNSERGVFKSTDGGVTWKRVLFRNDSTGAIDVEIDRKNPQVIYAALWQAFRKEYTASSGGAGSGLYKSTDGGTNWTEITRNPGLPAGIDGKIGIAVSPANSNRVYALVENAKGGLYSSDDGGATWKLVNSSHDITQRAFYYTHVYADPMDENLIYMQNTSLFKSTDGGKKLTTLRGTHGDFHDLWIDPDNGKHMVVGNDGGGAVSTDGGKKWTDQTFSTAQLYHVAATVAYPYDLCGAQQDASTICVSSTANATGGGRGFGRGSDASATYNAGGAEPGYVAPDPLNPNIYFAGSNNGGFLTRMNRTTGEYREVSPYPLMFSGEASSELVERWQWTYPIIFSPVDPHLLYASSQHLWKTTNNGQTWTRISPDLTRHDPSTMGPSGGPITHDMNAPEVYGTIFAIGPSKLDTNVIWTGSDDGLIYVTRDGGAHWTNVTPKDMPDFGRVSQIDASAFDGGAAYVAVKRPLLDDNAAYIYRTHDYGQTWTKIVNGLRADDYVHAVREDPSRKGLLFAATQHGVYMSYDDGDHWSSLSLNLPDLPVSDLIVYRHDIAISTHGRGFYLLENIVPLEQYSSVVQSASDAYLFAPPTAIRSTDGAKIAYWLKHPAKSVGLDILDASGKVIRAYAPDTTTKKAAPAAGDEEAPRRFGRGPAAPSKAAGLDHVTWDLRYESATSFPGMILWGGSTEGPSAPPGNYTIRLVVDGHTFTQPIEVKRNPLFTDVTDTDLQAQFALAVRIRDELSSANQSVMDIRSVRSQTDTLLKRNNDATLKQLGDKLNADAAVIEENIYQVKNESGQDPLNFPIKINNRIASLLSAVSDGDGAPIGSAAEIFDYLTGKLKVQTDALANVWATDLTAFNARAKALGLAAVKP